MDAGDVKSRIKETAVRLFDQNGYHGTTVREIAGEAGCSLPMIYYYYRSKKDLFHEIIERDFFDIVSRQAEKVTARDIVALYTEFVYELNHLSSHERKIYRLGVKVYLGFDGDGELMDVMDRWEKTIAARHAKLVLPQLREQENGAVIVRTLIHLLENLIESIVVKNRRIPKNEIRGEIAAVLDGKI